MRKIVINRMKEKDIRDVIELWFETSLIAHSFIPAKHWEENRDLMKSKYLPNSETYIATVNKRILGFISLQETNLAALFIKPDHQRKGIGKDLLTHVKNIKSFLRLKVYSKNLKAIEFYQKNSFYMVAESTDSATGEKEYTMEWHRKD